MAAGEKKWKLRMWGKKMKTEDVGKKNENEGEREKGEKGLENGLKTHL